MTTRPAPSAVVDLLADVDALLAPADARLAALREESDERQPVHTAYVPADRFHADLPSQWGDEALAALDRHAPSGAEFADVLGMDRETAGDLVDRVRAKLVNEPIEDLRLDFEDGYGARGDDVEDGDAVRAGRRLALACAGGSAPPFVGLRCKSLEPATRPRGLRTVDLFLAAALDAAGPPPGFVVTLPKVSAVEQVVAMAHVCERLESRHGLPAGSLRFEVQVEVPQAVLGSDGVATVARIAHAAPDRLTGLHYGTYDYSASLGIASGYQSLEHPAADHAKAVMQVAAAGTGVRISDGSTNVLPVGDAATVHAAWRLHARLVRRALERGIYQGWDMHPAHLPTRYMATYAFFAEGLPDAATRLRRYVGGRSDTVLDEPATAAAMARFIQRGVRCGAFDVGRVRDLSSLDADGLGRLARRRPLT